MRRYSLALLAGAALFAGIPAGAQAADTYKFDPSHTSVLWEAQHLGFSHPHGIFANIEGTLVVDEAAPDKSSINVTIPVDKIATGIPKFDEHLKSKDFFKTAEHPTATFKSTKVEKTGDKTAKVTGDLTLLGITKPVTLDVTLNGKGENPFSKQPTIGFSATGTIKRSEFGLSYGIPAVGDDVKITIESEASPAS